MLQGTAVVAQWEFETNWATWDKMNEAMSRTLEQWWCQTTENRCPLESEWASYVVTRDPLQQERILGDGRSGKTRNVRRITVLNGPKESGCYKV